MRPTYDQLAVTTLRLPPATPLDRVYYQMRFPGRWKPALRRLAQAQRGGDVASIPIASLNDAIAALVPDSVITLKRAGRGDTDDDWLLAYREINPSAIFNIVAAWVRAQKGTPEQIASVLAELRSTDLSWVKFTVDLNSAQHRTLAMRLLPMEIAATLSRPDAVCPHGELQFRRCTADEGAELISWPPIRIEEQTPFSVKIGITAQTLPTSDELLVHLAFGVRRWMPERGFLAFDHGHHVYLAPTVPYLAGLENSRHFGRARIKQARTTGVDGKAVYLPLWDDALARTLTEAGCLSRLPDPQQLTDKPMDYLQREGDAIALVYSTGMLKREKVSAGLSVADREPLVDWVVQTVAPHLQLAEPLPRVKATVYKGLAKPLEGPIPAEQICDAVGPRLDIELLTDTTSATVYALDVLHGRLGVQLPSAERLGAETVLVEVGPVTVGIRRPHRTGITEDLDRSAHSGRKVQAAVEARVAQIESCLPKTTHPTITLVEIAGPDTYSGPKRGDDPKFAIRHGLLLTRRLSQFVTPVAEPRRPVRVKEGREPADANRERFAAAIDDLFRQLGVRPRPLPAPVANTVDRTPALLAIWMIRQNKGRVWGITRQVPVAVLADPAGQHIQISAPQVSWQPLHIGLLEIGKRYVNADLRCGPDDATRFIKETIGEVVGSYPDTLLLTHAQNLRGAWPNISNTRVEVDFLGFGAAEPQPINKFPGLRHVRVRTAEGGETPECFGVSETDTGQPQGLWRFIVDRVYGSTAGKPSTAGGALKGVSKIAPMEYDGKPTAPKPKAQVWNSQLIELFVAALQDGDQPDHWAGLVHDLRQAAPYVKATTTLPWPLHLAEQIEEYLLPTNINYLVGEPASDDQ